MILKANILQIKKKYKILYFNKHKIYKIVVKNILLSNKYEIIEL